MGKLLKMQPSLIHVKTKKDVVYTPRPLAAAIINHFEPTGVCLDPCMGDGAFYDYLPRPRLWCEIERGKDFFSHTQKVDWVIGNPPYSCLLAWIRHSFSIAQNAVYLFPLHRAMGSYQFMRDVNNWGGIKEILVVGTGSDYGFPFGHTLAVIHYQKDYRGLTSWDYESITKEALI